MIRTSEIRIRSAHLDELADILALLERVCLPVDELGDHLATALVARAGATLVGCIALELYGESALLRSLAVDPAYRGRGLGQRLTQKALEIARQKGLTHVYLLTETASKFFPRFGFRAVNRDEVPSSVRASVEFTTACPSSALAMGLSLENVLMHGPDDSIGSRPGA